MADPIPQENLTNLKRKNLRIHVSTPEKLLYDGEAKSISTINERGPLDILAAHENFISIIKEKIVIIDLANVMKHIPIDNAVLRVTKNNVDIFVGITSVGLHATQEAAKPSSQ